MMKKLIIIMTIAALFSATCKKRKAEILDKQINVNLTNNYPYEFWFVIKIKNADFDNFTFEPIDSIMDSFIQIDNEGRLCDLPTTINNKNVRDLKTIYDYYNMGTRGKSTHYWRTDETDNISGNLYSQEIMDVPGIGRYSMSSCLFKLKKGPSGSYDTLIKKVRPNESAPSGIIVQIRVRDSIPAHFHFY